MRVAIDKRQTRRLAAALEGDAKAIRKQAAIALNAAGKKTESLSAKEIGRELATTQKNIKKTIAFSQKANATKLKSMVRISKTRRLSLREFNAKQNKSGVTAKVSKRTGRKLYAGGFQGPRPGVVKMSWRGHAFKRVGKKRLPIVKLKGPSPWGVFVKREMIVPVKAASKGELRKQVDRRIRFIELKKLGVIKNASA